MTAQLALQDGIGKALKAAIKAASERCAISGPLPMTEDGAHVTPSLPCISVDVSAMAPLGKGATLGRHGVDLTLYTSFDDDATGATHDALAAVIMAAMVADTVGPKVLSPWLLGGIENDDTPRNIEIEEEARRRRQPFNYVAGMIKIGG